MVVAIGASAGGLDALERFLSHVAAPCEACFVVIQHMDPTRDESLAELLGRVSRLPVHTAKHGARAAPGHVYVIPPNRDMSITRGVLHLRAPAARRGTRLPIDFFFRSLAADRGSRSVGVLLSGMGEDGTRGLRAIREAGGLGFAQAPRSAQFDSMPRHAIEAGVTDAVASPEELPAKILAYALHERPRAPAALDGPASASWLAKIIGMVRLTTGHDFSPYKPTTLQRRIERRMVVRQIADVDRYIRALRDDPAEVHQLFQELLIGVTSFFRDPAEWEQLKSGPITELLATCPKDSVVRAWVPGCSTGEEAYSLAMVFKEALEEGSPSKNVRFQIFATDPNGPAIERARRGLFPASVAADISPARLGRFFVEEPHGYRVRPELRELVVFATQDLVQDAPFTKLDLLVCRNVLIYFSSPLQQKLMPLFHYCLNPGGALFLGTAETVGRFTPLFVPVRGKSRIYRRVDTASALLEFPLRRPPSSDPPPVPRTATASRSSSVHARLALLERALLDRPDPTTSAHARPKRGRTPSVGKLEREIARMREQLGAAYQDMQSSQEELKSANEELQSSNEELMTSKEEMQSMNEELQTLNHELQAKLDELSRTSNDMANLLDSTELAIVFLDDALNVRRFTPSAAKIVKLISADIGRPISDLTSTLAYPELCDDAREVLRTLVVKERTASSRDGRSFRVRIMPYRTNDKRIDGVVITFTSVPSPRKSPAMA